MCLLLDFFFQPSFVYDVTRFFDALKRFLDTKLRFQVRLYLVCRGHAASLSL